MHHRNFDLNFKKLDQGPPPPHPPRRTTAPSPALVVVQIYTPYTLLFPARARTNAAHEAAHVALEKCLLALGPLEGVRVGGLLHKTFRGATIAPLGGGLALLLTPTCARVRDQSGYQKSRSSLVNSRLDFFSFSTGVSFIIEGDRCICCFRQNKNETLFRLQVLGYTSPLCRQGVAAVCQLPRTTSDPAQQTMCRSCI